MTIFLVSGDGEGAGKSTLAAKLVGKANVWALADALRYDLQSKYPDYDWFNLGQDYKKTTLVPEYGIKPGGRDHYSVREIMVEVAESRCQAQPAYWVERLVDRLKSRPVLGSIAIEGVRKCIELEYLKMKLPSAVHFHVSGGSAVKEALYDNEELAGRADYLVKW